MARPRCRRGGRGGRAMARPYLRVERRTRHGGRPHFGVSRRRAPVEEASALHRRGVGILREAAPPYQRRRHRLVGLPLHGTRQRDYEPYLGLPARVRVRGIPAHGAAQRAGHLPYEGLRVILAAAVEVERHQRARHRRGVAAPTVGEHAAGEAPHILDGAAAAARHGLPLGACLRGAPYRPEARAQFSPRVFPHGGRGV